MWGLYKVQPSFVLGFHGCDENTAEMVFAGRAELEASNNEYDWLGAGVYFWEASPQRALDWARMVAANPSSSRGKVTKPAVVGAIIDLRLCASLFDSAILGELATAWEVMRETYEQDGLPLPENKGQPPDRVRRYRDRAVVEFMHSLRAEGEQDPYDTVRGAFSEGGELFSGSGFSKRGHIQIAVRNRACIKGYFRPLLEPAPRDIKPPAVPASPRARPLPRRR